MGTELVKTSPVSVPAANDKAMLPALIERAGAAARFAWDEFFYAEHHNPHTQKAYMAAVKRFLTWAEGQGVELPAITPGMLGHHLADLGGSPAKRNLHLSALRGFFDRLVNRHVVVLNPAASVKGVKDQVVECKTPEIGIEQARALLASIDTGHVILDAGSLDVVGQDRPGGVEQDFPPLLVPLLGDVEVMLDAVGLQVPDAGSGYRRYAAAGQEEHAHQGQVAHALQAAGGDCLEQGDRL